MKTSWKMLAFPALLAALTACKDQPVAPQAEPFAVTQATAAVGIANAPTETGIVLRSAWSDILIWSVPSAGLEVVMGADAAAFCTLWDGGSGDPSPSFNSTITFADKVLFDRILTVGQDREAATQVWPYANGELQGFCDMVLGGAAPLATGTTRGIQFSSDFDGTNNHWNYHGFLTRPDGSKAVFKFQMQWREWETTTLSASLHEQPRWVLIVTTRRPASRRAVVSSGVRPRHGVRDLRGERGQPQAGHPAERGAKTQTRNG